MSTRSSAISTRRRGRSRPRARAARRRGEYFVVCVDNEGYEASLEPRKFYLAIPDPEADTHGQLRAVDESGEDYLFPAAKFAAARIPGGLRKRLLAAV